MTAVIAHRDLLDGGEGVVQHPDRYAEEMGDLKGTVRQSYDQMDAAQGRLLELLHHLIHRMAYKKRTELAVDIVRQLAHEGHFPQAQYALDHGLLPVDFARCIERVGK